MEDVFSWLQQWYAEHCDGEWEHHWGIDITSLDNPGWRVRINLQHTELEGRPFTEVRQETSEHDWLHCRVNDTVFEGAGGPYKLRAILEVFREWQQARL